jgi:hypothetical protein
MTPSEFIDNYREAFGDGAPLPIAFWYADESVAETPRTQHCFFREVIPAVRAGGKASLNADNINCGGGRFYTGFAPLRETTPAFVSNTERYKQTPEMVVDHIERSAVPVATRRWLNLVRVDGLEGWDGVEAIVFFATPDILSGLASWAWFDSDDEGAVTTRFGSGCSTIISDPAGENLRGGRRTFIGCMDISVRPLLGSGELSFAIPASRLTEMLATLRQSALFDRPAWRKVRLRISEGE